MSKRQAVILTILFIIAVVIVVGFSGTIRTHDGSSLLVIILVTLGIWKIQDIVSWFFHKLYNGDK